MAVEKLERLFVKNKKGYYKFKCLECGSNFVGRGDHNYKSCGCLKEKNLYKERALEINKDKNAPFEFIEIPKNQKNKVLVKCKTCGNIFRTLPQPIIEWKKLNRKGCRKCLGDRLKKGFEEIGGIRKHPAYNILDSIKQRCYNKNHKAYKDYGGRGIKVCDEWMDEENGYLNFIKWAEENGYKKGLTIDRIDVNGNYEPSNCRWIELIEQRENKRKQMNNKTGYRGVHMNGKYYCARVIYDKKQYDLGCFKYKLQSALTRALFIEKNKIKLKYDLDNKHQIKIIKWGAERLLFNYSKETEKRLIDEEIEELNNAKTIEEKIDALCDCYVVLTQTFAKAGLAKIKIEDDSWLQEMFNFYKKIPNKVNDLGYSFDCCINETIKEISSRVGSIGDDGKWYKDTSPEAKAKWYKADYSRCKRKD